MTSTTDFQCSMGGNILFDNLLVEKYAWVDERLSELYNRYSLTELNCDEFQAAGLLTERWAWVDRDLDGMSAKAPNNRLPCPSPLTWANYRCDAILDCLENEGSLVGNKRKRSESDITDELEEESVTKRLRSNSQGEEGRLTGNLFDYLYNNDWHVNLISTEYTNTKSFYDDINIVSDYESEDEDEEK